jgi:hypothetical protein
MRSASIGRQEERFLHPFSFQMDTSASATRYDCDILGSHPIPIPFRNLPYLLFVRRKRSIADATERTCLQASIPAHKGQDLTG